METAQERSKFQEYDDSFGEPEKAESWATYGVWRLVGNGVRTNANCGTFKSFIGCVRTELHGIINLNGENYNGKVYVRPVFHSCDKPDCPVCYIHGWAVREAHSIEVRLKEGSKRFGLVEHVVASVPVRDYGLEYEALRVKAVKILALRGIIGGVLIFHGFRYNNPEEARRKGVLMGWYWSPHFHVLGFIRGGYGRCRGCVNGNCVACSGFEGTTRRFYERDRYIVKVLDKRKTVGGTAWYQLNHASLKIGVRRFHVATWFGVCSYRKLKVKVEDKKHICPVCQHDLVKLRYFGIENFVLDKSSPLYRREFFADLMEGDNRVWVECEDDVKPYKKWRSEKGISV